MTIKETRIRAGLSRADMSKLLEIPHRTIEDWEYEKRNPPVWVEKMILETLNGISLEKQKLNMFNALKEEYPQYGFYVDENYLAFTFNCICAIYNNRSVLICNYNDPMWESRINDFFQAVKSYEEKDEMYNKVNFALEEMVDISLEEKNIQSYLEQIIINDKKQKWGKCIESEL